MNYKIILYGNHLYKEIVLSKEMEKGFAVGTAKKCQVRFFKARFLTDFLIQISRQKEQWVAVCESFVFLKKEDAVAGKEQTLSVGEKLYICDEKTKKTLFYLVFSIDFAEQNKNFNKKIFCADRQTLTIGGPADCTVQIKQELLDGEVLTLTRSAAGFYAELSKCRYGIALNGYRYMGNTVELSEGSIFSLNGFSFYYRQGYLYTSDTFPIVTQLSTETLYDQRNHLQYPKFIRSARQQYVIPEEKYIFCLLPPSRRRGGEICL